MSTIEVNTTIEVTETALLTAAFHAAFDRKDTGEGDRYATFTFIKAIEDYARHIGVELPRRFDATA